MSFLIVSTDYQKHQFMQLELASLSSFIVQNRKTENTNDVLMLTCPECLAKSSTKISLCVKTCQSN